MTSTGWIQLRMLTFEVEIVFFLLLLLLLLLQYAILVYKEINVCMRALPATGFSLTGVAGEGAGVSTTEALSAVEPFNSMLWISLMPYKQVSSDYVKTSLNLSTTKSSCMIRSACALHMRRIQCRRSIMYVCGTWSAKFFSIASLSSAFIPMSFYGQT